MVSKFVPSFVLAAGMAVAALPAQAVVLDFNGSICGAAGDQACTIRALILNYGNGPNHTVSYTSDAISTRSAGMLWWDTQYSDLLNVAYAVGSGAEIFINPASGYQVTLNGFDLGAWPNSDRTTSVQILDGLGNTLLPTGSITVSGSTHTSFDGMWSSAEGIRIKFGPDNFNVGIDNIDFTVSRISSGIPEPSTWAMMLIGFAGLGYAARRRQVASA